MRVKLWHSENTAICTHIPVVGTHFLGFFDFLPLVFFFGGTDALVSDLTAHIPLFELCASSMLEDCLKEDLGFVDGFGFVEVVVVLPRRDLLLLGLVRVVFCALVDLGCLLFGLLTFPPLPGLEMGLDLSLCEGSTSP